MGRAFVFKWKWRVNIPSGAERFPKEIKDAKGRVIKIIEMVRWVDKCGTKIVAEVTPPDPTKPDAPSQAIMKSEPYSTRFRGENGRPATRSTPCTAEAGRWPGCARSNGASSAFARGLSPPTRPRPPRIFGPRSKSIST